MCFNSLFIFVSQNHSKMQTNIEKQALIDWINSLNDETILKELADIKQRETFDFDEAWAKSISGDELRKRTKNYINSLRWKK